MVLALVAKIVLCASAFLGVIFSAEKAGLVPSISIPAYEPNSPFMPGSWSVTLHKKPIKSKNVPVDVIYPLVELPRAQQWATGVLDLVANDTGYQPALVGYFDDDTDMFPDSYRLTSVQSPHPKDQVVEDITPPPVDHSSQWKWHDMPESLVRFITQLIMSLNSTIQRLLPYVAVMIHLHDQLLMDIIYVLRVMRVRIATRLSFIFHSTELAAAKAFADSQSERISILVEEAEASEQANVKSQSEAAVILKGKEDEIASLNKTVALLAKKADEAEGQFEQAQKHLTDGRLELESSQKRMASLQSALDEKEKRLASSQSALDEKDGLVQHHQETHQQQKSRISDLESEVRRARSEKDREMQILTSRTDKEISTLRSDVADKGQKLKKQNETRESLYRENNALKAKLKEAEDEAHRIGTTEGRTKEAQDLKIQVEQRDNDLAALKAKVTEAETHSREWRDKCHKGYADKVELEKKLEGTRDRAKELLGRQADKAKALEEQLEEKGRSIESLNEKVTAAEASSQEYCDLYHRAAIDYHALELEVAAVRDELNRVPTPVEELPEPQVTEDSTEQAETRSEPDFDRTLPAAILPGRGAYAQMSPSVPRALEAPTRVHAVTPTWGVDESVPEVIRTDGEAQKRLRRRERRMARIQDESCIVKLPSLDA